MTDIPYSSPFDIRSSYSTLNKPLNAPVAASLVGHLLLLIIIIFGIPFIAKNPEVLYEPITVEILSAGDLAAEKKVDTPPPELKQIEPPPMKKQAPMMVEEAPPAPEVDQFVDDMVQAPTPPPPPIETPDSEVEEDKTPEKPAPVPVRKPKPPAKAVQKKETDKPKKSFDALLKNLQETKEKPVVTEQADVKSTQKATSFSAGQLSLSEMDAVRAQLAGCWNIQAGARYAEDLAVELSLVMSTDRTVISAKVVDQSRYNRDPVFRAAADSAMRAVRNPRCSPLNLPPAKYAEWKNLTLNFDPKNML